jgi:hypothetical protein
MDGHGLDERVGGVDSRLKSRFDVRVGRCASDVKSTKSVSTPSFAHLPAQKMYNRPVTGRRFLLARGV